MRKASQSASVVPRLGRPDGRRAEAGGVFGEWLPSTISPGLPSLKRKVWSSLKVSPTYDERETLQRRDRNLVSLIKVLQWDFLVGFFFFLSLLTSASQNRALQPARNKVLSFPWQETKSPSWRPGQNPPMVLPRSRLKAKVIISGLKQCKIRKPAHSSGLGVLMPEQLRPQF